MEFKLKDEETGSYLLTGASETHPYKDMQHYMIYAITWNSIMNLGVELIG